ncbi:MAG: tRNA (adenosine(37)-N6)-threonylcarbamoyltransferase complex dimerization subunit type 1 TsaB [Nitrospinota bacterium]|nr:tRNA (adenosine(37)-N6)-threonylcarbamoyltransferase complex dimerization subunit type 1 TsaB [Nitrospinota bacterium]
MGFDVSVPCGQITFLNCKDISSTTSTLEKNQKISTTLLPAIQETFIRLKLNAKNICGIGVSTGPGSYMNIRIGISTAKGLSLSLGCPIFGFSSLEILAEEAIRGFSESTEISPKSIICVRNADKDNIFSAKFEVSKKQSDKKYHCLRKTDDALIKFDEFEVENDQKTILVYSSMDSERIYYLKNKYKDPFLLPINTSSLSVGLLTLEKLKRGDFQNTENVLPTYCREVKLG